MKQSSHQYFRKLNHLLVALFVGIWLVLPGCKDLVNQLQDLVHSDYFDNLPDNFVRDVSRNNMLPVDKPGSLIEIHKMVKTSSGVIALVGGEQLSRRNLIEYDGKNRFQLVEPVGLLQIASLETSFDTKNILIGYEVINGSDKYYTFMELDTNGKQTVNAKNFPVAETIDLLWIKPVGNGVYLIYLKNNNNNPSAAWDYKLIVLSQKFDKSLVFSGEKVKDVALLGGESEIGFVYLTEGYDPETNAPTGQFAIKSLALSIADLANVNFSDVTSDIMVTGEENTTLTEDQKLTLNGLTMNGIQHLATGNLILTGLSSNYATNSNPRIFVAEISSLGEVVWQNQLYPNSYIEQDGVRAVVMVSNDVVISANAFKRNAEGNLRYYDARLYYFDSMGSKLGAYKINHDDFCHQTFYTVEKEGLVELLGSTMDFTSSEGVTLSMSQPKKVWSIVFDRSSNSVAYGLASDYPVENSFLVTSE